MMPHWVQATGSQRLRIPAPPHAVRGQEQGKCRPQKSRDPRGRQHPAVLRAVLPALKELRRVGHGMNGPSHGATWVLRPLHTWDL